MTYDGRAFFATEDALAHADTNKGQDIYEFVGGRPQLITTGTGETHVAGGVLSALLNPPGLVGVSAGGTDVYFSTYDTLPSQDHNGLFLKFYDARTGGGFPAPAPPPPCEAADECHGADSSPPGAMLDETSAPLERRRSRQGESSQAEGRPAPASRAQSAQAASPSRRPVRRGCRMTSRRSTGRSLIAIVVAVAATMALPAFAGANTPITAYSALPSNGQAGGHPDVELHFAVENRVLQHSESLATARTRKTRSSNSRRGSSGIPTQLRSARSPSSPPTNARSTRRWESPT